MREQLIFIAVASLFLLRPDIYSYPLPGVNERVGLNLTGGAPSAGCAYASMTPDGRFVAFQTGATDITPGDTNLNVDVYLRDRLTKTSERISLASDGTEPNAPSWDPSISGDGRYVAFRGDGSNTVPLDTNGFSDVFVRDRQTRLTERVSVTSTGAQAIGGVSIAPAISRDGRYVAFQSDATNLVAGDTNGATDIFVRDRQLGVTQRVSVGPSGVQANGISLRPSISADGRLVFFYSEATNLVTGDTNGRTDLFAHDRQTGVTERLSVATNGTEANNVTYAVARPAISGDGRYAAFYCEATNLVPSDTNVYTDVFVRDRVAGTTERVSIPSNGSEPVNGAASIFIGISDDGRFVTFEASAELVPEDTNSYTDIYVVDRRTGQAERVSATNEGTTANKDSYGPVIDASGRYPAFPTFASNLDNTPGFGQVYASLFVRDRGPQVGILEAKASLVNCQVSILGMARYAGAIIADGSDPANDGETGAAQFGAELTGASLIYRPEVGDLFARVRLASIPPVPGTGTPPATVYMVALKVAGVPYEIRATRIEAGAGTGQQFLLFRCDPGMSCSQVATLKGGIGTTGNELRVSLPLSTVSATELNPVTDVQISTGLGDVRTGIASLFDQMTLSATTIPEHRVMAGIAPAGTPESGVQFTVTAGISDGAYYAPLGAPAPGSWDVWARACFGAECGASFATIEIPAECAPSPVPLSGVVSRKIHGSAGPFDIDLPLTGASGIECRTGGATGDHTVIFNFATTLTSVSGASITAGTGSVSSSAIGADSHQYILNLTGVTNAQRITISLAGVNDSVGNSSANVQATMAMLQGDTNADGAVNSADIAQTKSQSGQAVSSSNFREDLTTDGNLNSADISLVKSKSGTALP